MGTAFPALKAPKKPSSIVHSHAYDPDSKVLRVRFHSGHTYDYAGVSAETATAFYGAKSPGGFVHSHIRGKHKHELVPKG